MIESNLDLCYENIFFVYMYTSFETQDESINTASRLFFVVVIGVFIIWSACFITCNREALEQEEVQSKFGSMYEDIKTDKLTSALYTTVFCIRRLLLVLALLFLKEKGETVIIYAFLLICSCNFAYLTRAMANNEQVLNKLELVNELGLMGVLYTMLFFIKTNQLSALVVWDAGVGTIGVLGFMFLINFGYMFTTSLRKAKNEAKLQLIKLRQRKLKRMKKFKKRVTKMTQTPNPMTKIKKKKKKADFWWR